MTATPRRKNYLIMTTAASALFSIITPAMAFASSDSSSFTTSRHAVLDFHFARPSLIHHEKHQHGLSMMFGGIPRGGAARAAASSGVLESLSSKVAALGSSPSSLFNTALISLALATFMLKILQRTSTSETTVSTKEKPSSVKSLQIRFLGVFWLLRCADWLQGPYFYEVYSSKVFNGVQASLGLVSKLFLTGFASTALFGPWVGRAVDTYGRKKGTLAFSFLYSLGAASTRSALLPVLFLGRVASGIGTSLLFSAPEAWLVGESQQSGDDPDGAYLGETFGLAYAGDSIVAILAGQFAGAAASQRGPAGPFELSVAFLAAGGILTSLLWNENKAAKSADGKDTNPSIHEAIEVVKDDPKIMLVGAVQSLFEAAMYIFVLQWPPAIRGAIGKTFGDQVATPFGTIFSCFMASCLLGSTVFSQLNKQSVAVEKSTFGMLAIATAAMGLGTMATNSPNMPLGPLVAGFFAFEACVGMYFPSIGTLRSKYVPDTHRSVIMNLFGIPLNVLVVAVFLSIKRLGVSGALGISTGALALATAAIYKLRSITSEKNVKAAPATT